MVHLVVIPAYNEQQALPVAVADLQRLAGEADEYHLLIVNDGSTDRTRQVAEELARTSQLPLHVLHHTENRGIGAAVQAGYRWAAERDYEYVIQFDGDGQHDARDVARLVAACRERNLDLCIGSRYLPTQSQASAMASCAASENLHLKSEISDLRSEISDFESFTAPYRGTFLRRLGTRWLSWLITRRTGVRITDATSGLRCAGSRALRLFCKQYPPAYSEPVALNWALNARLHVQEISATMRQRQGGVSSIGTLVAPWYMLRVTLSLVNSRPSFSRAVDDLEPAAILIFARHENDSRR